MDVISVEQLGIPKHVSDTLAREEKMENRGEGKSDGSCEAATAASKRFLCVLFLLWIDRQ